VTFRVLTGEYNTPWECYNNNDQVAIKGIKGESENGKNMGIFIASIIRYNGDFKLNSKDY
jgi:hypothetical protein